jgi:TonB-linked SusC/RagA family outer membrane protein
MCSLTAFQASDLFISYTSNSISIKDFFSVVRKQTNLVAFYNDGLLDDNQRIKVEFNKTRLPQVLNSVLKGKDVSWTVENNYILLKKSARSNPAPSSPLKLGNERVQGQVTDENNRPMQGVRINIKESKQTTSTDANGNYSLTTTSKGQTLVFSYIGYFSKEVLITQSTMNISLTPQPVNLTEVAITVGYGTQKKQDLTGAVGQVNIQDMTKAPVKSFDDALAGRLAGVQVVGNDGQPGSLNNIVIRGGNSITQDNSPLFVVDGFPLENADYNTISPSDIESIDVLKDASATAIYGARGANGVIIITTKKGKEGNPLISFNAYYGVQKITKLQNLMDPYQFVKYQTELNPEDAAKAYFIDGKTLESYRDIQGINFQDYVYQTGSAQNYDISLRGGTKSTKYFISGNILRQDGVFIRSNFGRNQSRISLDQAVNKNLKVGLNVNYSNSKTFGVIVGDVLNTTTLSPLFSVWAYRPVTGNNLDLIDDFTDGGFNGGTYGDFRVNPLINAENDFHNNINNNLIANGFAEYMLHKDLTLRVSGGITTTQLRNETFNNSRTTSGAHLGSNGSVYTTANATWLNENIFTYKKRFAQKHNVTVLGGFTMQGNNFERSGFSATALLKESLGIAGLDNSQSIIPLSASSEWGLISFLGRGNYSYDSKYLLTASIRADASSRFTKAHRWGYFPSGSVAWRMSSEPFFKSLKFISDAKLRVSYGSTGNNRVSDFPYLSQLVINNSYYSFNNTTPSPGASLTEFGNPDLKWETTYQTNIGYDLSLFDSRIGITADVYRKKTKELLLYADVPYTTGLSQVYKNIGTMQNEGLEFTMNTTNIKNDKFTWNSSFNISFNRNKVLALAENQQTLSKSVLFRSDYNNLNPYIALIGAPVAQFYGLVWEGVYQKSDFDLLPNGVYLLRTDVTTNGTSRATIKPGDIRYKDINGDLVVDAKDYSVIGRALPIHTGGFTNNFSYKGIDLNVFFQWSYGNDILNANRLIFEGTNTPYTNQFASFSDRWSDTNPSNTVFRAGGGGPTAYSSRVIEDGSFLRLKTVSMGYNLTDKLLQKGRIKSGRIYLSAQNLKTWTKYSGSDPEVSVRNSILTPGFDYSAYPRALLVTMGLNASF